MIFYLFFFPSFAETKKEQKIDTLPIFWFTLQMPTKAMHRPSQEPGNAGRSPVWVAGT